AVDFDLWIIGEEILPIFFAGVGDGRCDDLKIFRVIVGDDEEAVTGVINRVKDILFPGPDEIELAARLIRVQESNFAGELAVYGDENELPATRLGNSEKEALILLFVNDRVLGHG